MYSFIKQILFHYSNDECTPWHYINLSHTLPDSIIVGAPTWHTDEEVERSGTEWDSWLYTNLPKIDLSGKKVAVFGVGDQQSYTDVSIDDMNIHATNPFSNTLIANTILSISKLNTWLFV